MNILNRLFCVCAWCDVVSTKHRTDVSFTHFKPQACEGLCSVTVNARYYMNTGTYTKEETQVGLEANVQAMTNNHKTSGPRSAETHSPSEPGQLISSPWFVVYLTYVRMSVWWAVMPATAGLHNIWRHVCDTVQSDASRCLADGTVAAVGGLLARPCMQRAKCFSCEVCTDTCLHTCSSIFTT